MVDLYRFIVFMVHQTKWYKPVVDGILLQVGVLG